jgi:nucleotide-binding universal stress UspA family protein
MALTILTVVEDVPGPIRPELHRGPYGAEIDAETYVGTLVERLRTQVAEIDGVVVRDPIGPASGIRAHLDHRPAGLVALTTHARSGMQRVLLGAQAAGIVNASPVPCLVAPVTS